MIFPCVTCCATLHDLHLHLVLRYMISTCAWCYAAWSSLALDATLHDLRLHLDRWWRGGVGLGWGGDNTRRVSCYATWSFICTWCYATWSSRALDATLHDLHVHLTLRYMIFVYIWTDKDGVGLGWGGVGIIPNVSRATLHDLYLRLMLRYMIFTGTWRYSTWSSFAFAMDKDATSNSKKRLGGKGPLLEWHDQKRSSFLIFTKRIFDT